MTKETQLQRIEIEIDRIKTQLKIYELNEFDSSSMEGLRNRRIKQLKLSLTEYEVARLKLRCS